MNTKSIFSVIIFSITGLFLYSFVLPFKEQVVDTASEQAANMANAYEQANKPLALEALRKKRQTLGINEADLLKNFIPQHVNSGRFAYNIGQMANQNRLTIKNIQYYIVENSQNESQTKEKKLAVEMNLDGRYEDFANWVRQLERSNMLIDIDHVGASKVSNTSDIISFTIKVFAYGIKID